MDRSYGSPPNCSRLPGSRGHRPEAHIGGDHGGRGTVWACCQASITARGTAQVRQCRASVPSQGCPGFWKMPTTSYVRHQIISDRLARYLGA